MRTSHRLTFLALVFALAFAAGGCKDRDAAAARAKKLDVLGEIPDFALTDQTGKPFARADLEGKVVIANFIFTRCPTVCPVFTARMQRLTERLADSKGLLFVSFSVDPEYDTPEVLARYAKKRDIDGRRWKFLTGDPAAIKRTSEEGLKLVLQRRGTLPDGTPDIVHDPHFVLLDRRGRIRGYYNSTDRDRLDALIADARALAAGGSDR